MVSITFCEIDVRRELGMPPALLCPGGPEEAGWRSVTERETLLIDTQVGYQGLIPGTWAFEKLLKCSLSLDSHR